jgi:glycosyltransferase involved in cell wall biosynthesis
MTKKRILCCSEASFLSTGYAVYTKELLNGLWATGKYEIAELARYCEMGDPRLNSPWIVYPNMPNRENQQEQQEYSSNIRNEFGKWRFNEVVLDFKPDIVISIADIWMDDFIPLSELRPYFKWFWMAPVDSAPQDDAWFEFFKDVDGLMFYSDWGKEIVQNQGQNLNILDAAPAAVETNIFKPVEDKGKHKQSFGLNPNTFIIGSVMRNQKRKLFPDLIESFSKFLKKCKENGNDELYNRSLLYLHTTYPDIGWNIPELLREHGVASKTLVTYRCTEGNCGHCNISFFNGARTFCPKCGNYTYGLPNTQLGVSREFLAKIYNLFDIFCAYSIAEGQCLPIVEAASCSVPTVVVNYSAMVDAVKKLNAIPISVQRLFREAETNAYRAYPDNAELADKLYSFAKLPTAMRRQKGFQTYRAAIKNYTWKDSVAKWDKGLSGCDSSTFQGRRLPLVNLNFQGNISNTDFLNHCFTNILGQPDKIGSHQYLKMYKWLTYGAKIEARGGIVLPDDSVLAGRQQWAEYGRKQCIEDCKQLREQLEYWEARKHGRIKANTPLFVNVACNRTIKDGQVVSVNSL